MPLIQSQFSLDAKGSFNVIYIDVTCGTISLNIEVEMC